MDCFILTTAQRVKINCSTKITICTNCTSKFKRRLSISSVFSERTIYNVMKKIRYVFCSTVALVQKGIFLLDVKNVKM